MSASLHIRVVKLEERAKAERRALKMQAKEYERRLETLNHEHAKQVEERSLTVSAEKFEGYEKEQAAWRDQVNKILAQLQGHTVGIGSARQLTFQVLPLLVSMGALVAVLLK